MVEPTGLLAGCGGCGVHAAAVKLHQWQDLELHRLLGSSVVPKEQHKCSLMQCCCHIMYLQGGCSWTCILHGPQDTRMHAALDPSAMPSTCSPRAVLEAEADASLGLAVPPAASSLGSSPSAAQTTAPCPLHERNRSPWRVPACMYRYGAECCMRRSSSSRHKLCHRIENAHMLEHLDGQGEHLSPPGPSPPLSSSLARRAD